MSQAPVSPNILNYTVGKGFATFQKDGAGAFVDLGNITTFEFTPSVDKLDHFSTRGGVKAKDRSITVSLSGELKIVMEEFTRTQFVLGLLGVEDTNSAGQDEIEILAVPSVKGAIKFTSTGDVGQKWDWYFPNVEFTPSAALSPLSDEWGNIEVTGEVTKKNNSFGKITYTGGEGATSDSESA